jgi:hypothetical protein
MGALRQGAVLWLVLFTAYAAAIAIDHRTTAVESRRLLVAESIVTDSDLDVADDAAARRVPLPPRSPKGGRLEPAATGFALAIAPALKVGGETGVRLFLAAIAALGGCLAVALARRVVPDPWATGAALAVGLSPPMLVAAGAVAPQAIGATVLAGAALLALRVRDAPRATPALWCALLLSMTPWLSLSLVPGAVVIAGALARWLRRRRRGVIGFIAVEVVLVSVIVYVTLHERLYGELSPYGPQPTGVSGLGDHLERWPSLAALLVDRDIGLLRWAPMLVLVLVAAGLLVRSRRARLARVISSQIDVEVATAFLLLIVGATWVAIAFLAPGLDSGSGPAAALVCVLPVAAALCAIALRRAPRIGGALAALSVVAGMWVLIGAAVDGTRLRPPDGPVPWGGAERILPRFAQR